MPANRNALIRYRTIDNCLRNRYRKWTLEDLIEKVSDTLYDYEGIDKGVSKRTVQMDIQMMRSDKLGYNAPIIVVDKKFYTYEDPEYSITNIPLTDQDLGKLMETIDFLKQFKGFSHFQELEGMVQKLEDQIYSQKTQQKPVIDFEKNENLRGLEYLDSLYQAIINKQTIQLTYQSFKAREASTFEFHPYLLKEFKNRWFIIGLKKKREGLLNLALDRIIEFKKSEKPYIEDQNFDAETYFQHVIGVSVNPNEPPEKIVLYITNKHAPYVLTKPLHWSQKLIEKDHHGVTISIEVQHNFELEKEILGLGDGIKVIEPARLKRNIRERLSNGIDLYNTEISESGLVAASRKVEHKGSAILNHVFSQKEVRLIKKMLDEYFTDSQSVIAQRELLKHIPKFSTVLLNKNLKHIIDTINPNASLVKAIYFNKPMQSNWYVTWHQDLPINVNQKIATKGYKGWTFKDGITSVIPPIEISKNSFTIRIHLDDTDHLNGALKVIHGSHKKVLTDEEKELITNNSIPADCEVYAGGIHLMKPLLLHASGKTKNQKQRRVIHLEFSSEELAGDLEWSELLEIPR